jgi:solute carrier family 25 thiamine pyrophosphate transporter 19
MGTSILLALDVIGIHFIQLQVEPLNHSCKDAKYWGVAQAAHNIVKEEGVQALWKGHVPAQVLSIVYGVVQVICIYLCVYENPN